MPEEISAKDLQERLGLIESMIAEGRHSTARWGWCFVLWGVAFYAAMAWAAWGPHGAWSWPVTMIAASALTVILAGRSAARAHPGTTLGRAVSSVWIGVGISMFVLLFALGWERLLEPQIFAGILSAMLGAANGASSLILKWRAQFGCTLVWWAACAVCVSGSPAQRTAALLTAIFLCQIVFGVYAMIADARRSRQDGLAHA
jgi:hypothetical protein